MGRSTKKGEHKPRYLERSLVHERLMTITLIHYNDLSTMILFCFIFPNGSLGRDTDNPFEISA